MNKKTLIISFDVPYPDNYGGAKDVWQRILYLKSLGHDIDLVSFYKDGERLERFEGSAQRKLINIHVPVKQAFSWLIFSALPLSVARRIPGKEITAKLSPRYDHCIIEGLKCIEAYKAIKNNILFGKVSLRMHNIESEYHMSLAKNELNILGKLAHIIEAVKFRKLEGQAAASMKVASVMFTKQEEMERCVFKLAGKNMVVRPSVYIDNEKRRSIKAFIDRKDSILYVGNLDLPDNRAAVKTIVSKLAGILISANAKLVITGKYSGNREVLGRIIKAPNIELSINVEDGELIRLYDSSKVFLSWSMNPSGVKLKLMEALSYGLPTISNKDGHAGSGMEKSVIDADDMGDDELIKVIKSLLCEEGMWSDKSRLALEGATRANDDALKAYKEVLS